MKKSEVLRVLGDYVVSYCVENILSSDWLVVEVKTLTAYHMAMLNDKILSIDATKNKTLRINFCSIIEID